MKFICKMLGGSHAYGLNTPESDLDYRGVFLHTESRYIIGLDRFEHIDKKGESDEFYFEFRHFLNLLRKTNTVVLELLYNDNWLLITPEFKNIQDLKNNLLDSDKFFKSLCGYLYNERRLALGERTGQLGGKRKAALDKYGYSYKNVVQFLRLCRAGEIFFFDGFFPVNIQIHHSSFAAQLMDIKLYPEKYNINDIQKLMDRYEINFKRSYSNRKHNFKFNEEIANDLCRNLYLQQLTGTSI